MARRHTALTRRLTAAEFFAFGESSVYIHGAIHHEDSPHPDHREAIGGDGGGGGSGGGGSREGGGGARMLETAMLAPRALMGGVLGALRQLPVATDPSFARLAESEAARSAEAEAEKARCRRELAASEARRFPRWILLRLCGSWALLLLLSLLRGGHGAPPLLFSVPCGGAAFWLLPALIVASMLAVTALAGGTLRRLHEHKEAIAYPAAEGDVRWEADHLTRLPLTCTLAGVAAGMLGIGGGMVQGPLMLELNMLPSVSAATSAFNTLFTSSSTMIQFTLIGALRLDHSVWYGGVGVVGTCIGQHVAGLVVRRFRRQSIIVFVLGGIIGLSAIVMGLVGAAQVYTDYMAADWEEFALTPLCE